MSDLVIISNRGPFSFSGGFLNEVQDSLEKGLPPVAPEFGDGGLVKAMAGLLKAGNWNPTWIGASMGDRDVDVSRGHYNQLFQKMTTEGYAPEHFPQIQINPDNRMHFRYQEYDFYLRFVFFDTKHMHSYYNKFTNGFLWPLMHLTRSPLFYKKAGAFPRPYFEKNDFVQYTSSGVTFANTTIDEIHKSKEFLRDGDPVVVWNQDYHLMQVSEVFKALLREEGFSAEERKRIHVGHFMHTPFFNIHEIQGLIREDKRNKVKRKIYDPFGENIESVLQKLTWGMLANDFIGFHTKEYCDNYLEALEEWFPVEIRVVNHFYEIRHENGTTTIGALPIGLDVDKIISEVSEGKTLEYQLDGKSLSSRLENDRTRGKYIFGGLERCDYTKGLVERLSIFQHAFFNLKVSNQDSCFYQVTAPSRSENPDYQKLQTLLDQEIKKVNGKLQGEHVIHVNQGISPPQNYRFMKAVDVMMVTPLEDGMNLVAFEYILSQKHKQPESRGILALSTSGASRVLKEKGFGEADGIVYINPMRPKTSGEKIAEGLRKGLALSEKVIDYVEKERRVDDWAEKNIDAILGR
ncbi:MAG: trehalose-6-phosphate synthase [Desulfatiglandaceae bacterium]